MITLAELQKGCLIQIPELANDRAALLARIDNHIAHHSLCALYAEAAWLSRQLYPEKWQGREGNAIQAEAETVAHNHFAKLFREWKAQLEEGQK
jgi:hypothetical protein